MTNTTLNFSIFHFLIRLLTERRQLWCAFVYRICYTNAFRVMCILPYITKQWLL